MRVAVLSFAHERAATYARLLAATPGVELVIADPDGPPQDPARGRAVARELGAAYAEGWDEAFALRPDAVVVTSGLARRRDLVERAAGAGAHVLCEQPLAATATDALAMVRACEEAGVRLTPASPECSSPAFAAVREGLAAGTAIGRLTTVHGACNAPAAEGPEAGAVLAANAASLLALVDAVLGGQPAERVYAQSNGLLSGGQDVQSAALMTVRYADGTVASLDCSRGLAGNPSGAGGPALTFVGERGSVDFTARPRLIGGFDSATGAERWEPGGGDLEARVLGAFLAGDGDGGGGDGPGPDGAAAVRTLRIIEAAIESSRTGRPVEPAAPAGA
ncbi:Gfo/Idh/MocA family oxidoreductase [Streptomyces racemochromogenes]|uniref:Gfo/Idh/MocA family oxidoreductase n=1 Tax=Streptomyces racemochromogenes TaxID=67353 RepID=A0ABW7PES3_9ACTN